LETTFSVILLSDKGKTNLLGGSNDS